MSPFTCAMFLAWIAGCQALPGPIARSIGRGLRIERDPGPREVRAQMAKTR